MGIAKADQYPIFRLLGSFGVRTASAGDRTPSLFSSGSIFYTLGARILQPIFNYDKLHIGGGYAEHLRFKLPANVRLFSNVDGMTGGTRLWSDVA